MDLRKGWVAGMGRRHKELTAFAAAIAVALGGCSHLPKYEHPNLEIPAAWRGEQAQSPVWPSTDWWRGFGSPQLDTFITQAQTGNLDLAAAVARVRQADAQTRIAGAALLPAIGLGSSVSRNRQASSGLATGSRRSTYTLYDAQISASYEIDFWGKNRAALDVAKQSAQASRYSEETVALTTVTSVATSYFQILELRDQLAVTEGNLESAESVLKALQAQLAAGTVTALDVAQQETTVAILQAQIPPLKQQLRQFIDALAILLGKPPEAIDVTSGTLADLSHPGVLPGLPSELLTRRPDVAMAEAELKAANADIAVARAAFFPSVQLTAQGGFESTALSSLFGPAGFLYTLAAGLTQPIFQGGRLRGQYQYSQAFYDELLQNYRKSVISAFQDVEDALVATQQTAEQERQQQVAVDTAQRAYEIATAQLRAGTINVLTVLNTETALFSAQNTLVQVKLARVNASVSLFKALGGGWNERGAPNA
jgi:NodT family efflux transporter outer membrane factor (OMF) lipoprotein